MIVDRITTEIHETNASQPSNLHKLLVFTGFFDPTTVAFSCGDAGASAALNLLVVADAMPRMRALILPVRFGPSGIGGDR